MDQFWGAMLGALLGAAFGTLSTLFTTWITQRFADRRAELAALSDLVMDMHYRPSLLKVPRVRVRASPKLKLEVEHRVKHALKMRQLVEHTRRALPPGARTFKTIGAMQAAVNVFLEAVEEDETGLQIYQDDLRAALTDAVAAVASGAAGGAEPGAGGWGQCGAGGWGAGFGGRLIRRCQGRGMANEKLAHIAEYLPHKDGIQLTDVDRFGGGEPAGAARGAVRVAAAGCE